MVSVKGLTTCGGITRVSYTTESGGVGPWGGAPRAMLHGAGQYAFVNVSESSSLVTISSVFFSPPFSFFVCFRVFQLSGVLIFSFCRFLSFLSFCRFFFLVIYFFCERAAVQAVS